MNTYRNPASRLFVMVTILALLVVVMLACGPADQYHAESGTAPAAAPQEADPTETPEPEVNSYPNLDETLQDIVRRYEAKELSEADAAALAPEHHDTAVLVRVETSTAVGDVDTWMEQENINPRYANSDYGPTPFIYAYVNVSVLGSLSEQAEVIEVLSVVSPFAGFEGLTIKEPARADGTARSSTGPVLPGWLKGYSGRSNDKIRGWIATMAEQHAAGTLDLAEWRDSSGYGPAFRGNNVSVIIEVKQPENRASVITWLAARDIEELPDLATDTRIVTHVPVALLTPLSELEAVNYVRQDGVYYGGPDLGNLPPAEAGNSITPRAGSYTSQGVAAMGADAWHPAYTGSDVKIGIIDSGFYGYRNLITSGDVPANVAARCYTFTNDTRPSPDIGQCGRSAHNNMDKHGSAVAEAIYDTAPGTTTFSWLFPNPAVARWAPSDPRPLPGWSQPWRARCSSSIPCTGPSTRSIHPVHGPGAISRSFERPRAGPQDQ